MAAQDIRLERIDKEYGSLRGAQTKLFNKVDSFESAVLGLSEVVAENRELILSNRDLIMSNRELIVENRNLIVENRNLIVENRDLIIENRDLIIENRNMIMENREMLRAIIKHLDVPYKPPMGFSKE